MPEGLFTVLAAALNLLAFALMALGQERHWCTVAHDAVETRVDAAWLHGTALACHVASLLLFIRDQGPSFGSLLWVLALSAAAMAIAFMLSWRPRWLRVLVPLLRRTTSA